MSHQGQFTSCGATDAGYSEALIVHLNAPEQFERSASRTQRNRTESSQNQTMTQLQRKYLVIVLAVMISVGSLANAASGLPACPVKRCCCAAAAPDMMGHHGQAEQHGNCSPQKPAPCCKIEPTPQKTFLAISSPPETPHQRTFTIIQRTDSIIESDQIAFNFNPLLEFGRTKIPLVPIYLQNLSFLC